MKKRDLAIIGVIIITNQMKIYFPPGLYVSLKD